MMKLTLLKSLCLMLVGTAFTTHAAVNLDRTRIVFPESDKASSLKIENQSKALPYLAQVRIVKQAATSQLPKDRESLFYFNLREVPPKSTSASDERSVMQVAMQSRIKLFWRPKAITKKPGEQAEMRMEVSATANGLTIHNPTPYYITLAWLSKNARTMLPGFDSLMLAPFATATTSTGDYHGNYYSIGYIDDYGALKKVDVQCAGTAQCSLTERKIEKDAQSR